MKEVALSILCPTYQHAAFLVDALESFVMQRTKFSFEVLVHDDASTDGTVGIIRRYERHHPSIIRGIYQSENQYSKGVAVQDILVKEARGKYLAICEGDDYWTDPIKLQRQFDYMEAHPECSVCVHAGRNVDASTNKTMSISKPSLRERDFTVEELILTGDSSFLTNSMMIRAECLTDKMPFYNNLAIGNYPLLLFLSTLGNVHYMPAVMSNQRIGHKGSWTANNLATDKGYRQHFLEIEQMLLAFDVFTEGKYHHTITQQIKRNELLVLVKEGKFLELKKSEWRSVLASFSLRQRLILYLQQHNPSVFQFLEERQKWFPWALK